MQTLVGPVQTLHLLEAPINCSSVIEPKYIHSESPTCHWKDSRDMMFSRPSQGVHDVLPSAAGRAIDIQNNCRKGSSAPSTSYETSWTEASEDWPRDFFLERKVRTSATFDAHLLFLLTQGCAVIVN